MHGFALPPRDLQDDPGTNLAYDSGALSDHMPCRLKFHQQRERA